MTPVVDVASPSLPREYSRTSADRLAERTAASAAEARVVEQLPTGGDLIRTAVPVRSSPNGPVAGVVVASEYLTDQFATRARGMTEAYEAYQQLRVLKQPLAGVYLSFFLMLTLMILVGATWMGLYLAKRISRPVQTLAAAADEIGAGHLDYRVKAEADDEFGSLIDAFNRMAGELAASRRRLERSSIDLERKHSDVESRRRYVETILDRLATGVISVDVAGSIRTWNAAASRLLGIEQGVSGLPVSVGARIAGSQAAGNRDRRGRPPPRGPAPAGGVDHARRARGPPLGDDHAARAGRFHRGSGRRVRRRDAAGAGAESRGVARGGAPARARDQESAHADSTQRRAAAAALLPGVRRDPRSRGRVHDDDRRRGRVAQGAGR